MPIVLTVVESGAINFAFMLSYEMCIVTGSNVTYILSSLVI